MLTASCHKEAPDYKTVAVDINNFCPIEDLFEDYYSVPLETTNECLISGIDKIQIEKNNIYILDKKRHTVHIFNKNGFFIKKINRYGQGPGIYGYSRFYGCRFNDLCFIPHQL
jgi:hypothetical protein